MNGGQKSQSSQGMEGLAAAAEDWLGKRRPPARRSDSVTAPRPITADITVGSISNFPAFDPSFATSLHATSTSLAHCCRRAGCDWPRWHCCQLQDETHFAGAAAAEIVPLEGI
jgi:hypothetical protein